MRGERFIDSARCIASKLVFSSQAGFNNFNDRQGGGFNDTDSYPRSGRGQSRNWREDDGDRRNFQQRGSGSFERKGSRWMANQDDEYDDDSQQQDSSGRQDQSSRDEESFNDNGAADDDNDYQQQDQQPQHQQQLEDSPPGMEAQQQSEQQFQDEPANNFPANESLDNHDRDDSKIEESGGVEIAPGNTTPLCDEAESKE